MKEENKNIDVVILCGGMGSRLAEETYIRPKPMVEIGGKPILWHIMKYYTHFGFKRFILCLGYKSDYIKKYFYDFKITNSNFTIDLNPESNVNFHDFNFENNIEICCVDTGLNTLKGGRLKRVEEYIKSENFCLTYGDGLSNVNLDSLLDFHYSHKKIATVTAVRPPSRFGEMVIDKNSVLSFDEKSQMNSGYINGGFFVFNKKILSYLNNGVDCDLEFGALQNITSDGELMAFKHNDFWQCMDNVRERDYLNKLFESGNAPWIK